MGFLLSLGTNIEPRVSYLQTAINEIGYLFNIESISSIYETSACDDTDQADFLNIALLCSSDIVDPVLVLDKLLSIEDVIGRVRDPNRPKGPRVIDIDMLLFDDVVLDTQKLRLPHPRIWQRNFVLIPMKELLVETGVRFVDVGMDELERAILSNSKDQIVTKVGVADFE